MNRETSTFLDALRLLAAVFVVLSHFSWQKISGGVLPYFPGHAAVMVFFVLSGYVIAYAATEREKGLRDFTLNRLARLWSVVIPALLITLCFDLVGNHISPTLYNPETQGDPIWRLFSAAFFLGQIWFLNITPLSNEPFWSLPFEFWYYAIFGAALHLRGISRVVAITILGLICGPKILMYLPIWWLGVWLYQRPAANISVARARTFFVCCAALIPAWFLLGYRTRIEMPWVPVGFSIFDFPLALSIGGMIWSFGSCRISLERVAPIVRKAASCTFTIYLCHLPILLLLTALIPGSLAAPIRLPIVLLGALAICVSIAQVTEKRKAFVRRLLERFWPAGTSPDPKSANLS